jgi:hypothetical protein
MVEVPLGLDPLRMVEALPDLEAHDLSPRQEKRIPSGFRGVKEQLGTKYSK